MKNKYVFITEKGKIIILRCAHTPRIPNHDMILMNNVIVVVNDSGLTVFIAQR